MMSSYHFFPPSSSLPPRKLAFQWSWSHAVAMAHRDKQQQTSGWTVGSVVSETFWVVTTWEYVKCQNMNSNRTPPRLQELGAIWDQQFLRDERFAEASADTSNTTKARHLILCYCKSTNSYSALRQLNSLCKFVKFLRVVKTLQPFFEYLNWIVEFCISPGHSPRLEQNSHADQRGQVAGRVQPCHFLRKTKDLA